MQGRKGVTEKDMKVGGGPVGKKKGFSGSGGQEERVMEGIAIKGHYIRV